MRTPRPEIPTASTHGYVTLDMVNAAVKARDAWDAEAKAEEIARRLELMKATPITFEVALRLWADPNGPSLINDDVRACFFSCWALAARELADAFIEEAGK